MSSVARMGDAPAVRLALLVLWIGCVLWLRNVIPLASFESEGTAFAVWSRVGLPVTIITWLWVYRRHPIAPVALGTFIVGGAIWSTLLLVSAAGPGLDYALRDAYFLRQPIRLFLLSGVEMLFLILPPAIGVAGLFSVLTDRRRHADPSG